MKNGSSLPDIERCRVRVVHQARVGRARHEALSEKGLQGLATIFKLLGDPTRLKMVLALSGGEMCVCDLAAFLGLSESAVSHQLRRMREQNLVKPRREAQVLYYAVDNELLADLVRTGLGHVHE
jgi:ArsR family transcriptional regulator, lead/cadmium/zinc/bismuth-responsive transcriptional repressor